MNLRESRANLQKRKIIKQLEVEGAEKLRQDRRNNIAAVSALAIVFLASIIVVAL